MESNKLSYLESLLSAEEVPYSQGWQRDAEKLIDIGLYGRIAELVDPQDGETIVDVGTGFGYQLLSLNIKNAETRLIGTERTCANMMNAMKRMEEEGLDDIFGFFSDSTLDSTSDGRLFWKRGSKIFQESRQQLVEALDRQILLLDDNILYPQLLQQLLPEGNVDAGILSMPGGSGVRSYEWPFRPEKFDGQEDRKRMYEITNATRRAFYHFMAQYSSSQGRIVVADRMGVDPAASAPHVIVQKMGEHMGDALQKYWRPQAAIFIPMDFRENAVTLKVTEAERDPTSLSDRHYHEKKVGIGIARFNRTNEPFNEPPMDRPIPLLH